MSVFGDDPVIKHLVGILSHSIIDLCNRMQPSIFFNPMSEIFRGGRPGLFDDYWFSSLSHSLVSKPILFAFPCPSHHHLHHSQNGGNASPAAWLKGVKTSRQNMPPPQTLRSRSRQRYPYRNPLTRPPQSILASAIWVSTTPPIRRLRNLWIRVCTML